MSSPSGFFLMASLCLTPRVRSMRHLAVGLMLLTGCASQTPPPPSEKPSEPEMRPLPEEFDPQVLNEDLLLIQPTFSPADADSISSSPLRPSSAADAPAKVEARPATAPGRPPAGSADAAPAAVTPQNQTTYRVQVFALSQKAAAERKRQELSELVSAPVVVQTDRDLFMVRVGAYTEAADARELKERLARLRPEYADAYLVRDVLEMVEDSESRTDTAAAATGATAADSTTELPGSQADELAPFQQEQTRAMTRVFGWRVLLEKTSRYEDAQRLKRQVSEQLRRSDVDITFKAPWYNVEIGYYRTETEAQQALEGLKRRFPNALKVRGQILVPVEE